MHNRSTMKYFIAISVMLLGALTANRAMATLPIQHWQTASGAQVYFVENHDLPMLDLSVDFPAGAAYNSRAQSGLASLTLHMLDAGADGLTEDDIARRFADVGAGMGAHFDDDRAGITLRTLSSERERLQALDTFTRVLQRPEYPESVLQREKTRTISGLKEAETRPESIGSKAFSRLLYGQHPYGNWPTIESISALKRDDLVNFHRSFFTADRAVIALMGDVTRNEAERIANALVAQLPPKGVVNTVIPEVPLPQASSEERIVHPATQSHISMGFPGIRRQDPDYFPLVVGNYTLGGGGFSSRLTDEVRTKRGLVYSVHSSFSPMKQAGPFSIGLQTRKEEADVALKVVKDTLRDFIAKGPTARELRDAKSNIIGGFPLRIDSNKKIIEYLSVIGFYNLPLTYLDDYVKAVDKVTVAEIKSAFARRIDPERMVTVIVGAPPAK